MGTMETIVEDPRYLPKDRFAAAAKVIHKMREDYLAERTALGNRRQESAFIPFNRKPPLGGKIRNDANDENLQSGNAHLLYGHYGSSD